MINARILGFAAVFAVSTIAFLPGSANALSVSECSIKYKAAKADGTDGGLKWNEFRKAQCAADSTAAAPEPAPVEKTTAKKPKKVPTPVVEATPSGSFMANCSDAWKQMKANNTTPPGMSWREFVAGKCQAAGIAPPPIVNADTPSAGAKMSIQECSGAWKKLKDSGNVPDGMTWNTFRAGGCQVAGVAPQVVADTPATGEKLSMQQCSSLWKQAKDAGQVTDGMTWNSFRKAGCQIGGATVSKTKTKSKTPSIIPPEPSDQADATPIPTVDKAGKVLSPGRIAAIKRIRACGKQYQTLKANDSFPAQIAALDSRHRWPGFWSLCNKQLKAQGQ